MRLNGAEVDPKSSMPLVLLNPELSLGKETVVAAEGCLSFPEITADIRRALAVTLRAENTGGRNRSRSKRPACLLVRCSTKSIISTAFYSSIG
jgi:peptide deformylase